MCLVIFAYNVSSRYPFVVAANRDEFHARPTQASHFWPSHPELLAGRDEEQGGTWMGITRGGRFAAITNYRDPSRTAPAPRSRGELPLSFLTGIDRPETFLKTLAPISGKYAGFNLVVGDQRELWYFSNSEENTPSRLAPGIYGLSNAQLDTPWPKSELGKHKLSQLLDEQVTEASALNHERLAAVVLDRHAADSNALHALGLASEMEQLLSAQFIVTEGYGTRSCTTLWVEPHGQVNWRELSFDNRGNQREQRVQSFALPDKPDN